MKQNMNIFIMIGLVVLVCGQLQSSEKLTQFVSALRRFNATINESRKISFKWEMVGIVAEAIVGPKAEWLGAVVATAVAKRRIENRLKNIQQGNTLNSMFSRAQGAVFDYIGIDLGYDPHYKVHKFLDNAKKKAILDLEKAVTKEVVAGNKLAVKKVLETVEEKLRNSVIRSVETIKFDDMIKKKSLKLTKKLLQQKETDIAKIIDRVNKIESEVRQGSKLVRQIAKSLKVSTISMEGTLRVIENRVRQKAKKAISLELSKKYMEGVMQHLPYEIIADL